MLSRLTLMVQAAVMDGQFLDLLPPFDNGGVAPEVGVGVATSTGGTGVEEYLKLTSCFPVGS